MDDPLVILLRDHMRVAVEGERTIRCWCDERFDGGHAHRVHVAELIRVLLEGDDACWPDDT